MIKTLEERDTHARVQQSSYAGEGALMGPTRERLVKATIARSPSLGGSETELGRLFARIDPKLSLEDGMALWVAGVVRLLAELPHTPDRYDW